MGFTSATSIANLTRRRALSGVKYSKAFLKLEHEAQVRYERENLEEQQQFTTALEIGDASTEYQEPLRKKRRPSDTQFRRSPLPDSDISPNDDANLDDGQNEFIVLDSDESQSFREKNSIHTSPSRGEAFTYSSLPSSYAEAFHNAKFSLEHLFPGEIALALVPEDPKQFFDAILEHVQILKAQIIQAREDLSSKETHMSQLRTEMKAMLEQLDRARKYAVRKSAEQEARTSALEENVRKLTLESQEKDRSMHTLLDRHQTDTAKINTLRMLVTQKDSDLKSVESSTRRIWEVVKERNERIGHLERQIRELKDDSNPLENNT
jgi:hypothetical protein